MKKFIVLILLLMLCNSLFAQSKRKSNLDENVDVAYASLLIVRDSLMAKVAQLGHIKDSLDAELQKAGQNQRNQQVSAEKQFKERLKRLWNASELDDRANRPLSIFAAQSGELRSSLNALPGTEWKRGYELLLAMIESLNVDFNEDTNTSFKEQLDKLPNVAFEGGTNLKEKVKYGIINFRNISFEFERVKKLVDDSKNLINIYETLKNENELTYVMKIPYYDRALRDYIKSKTEISK